MSAPDYVGRLRLLAIMLEGLPPAAPQLLRDAAEEIERLKAALAASKPPAKG